MCARAQPAPREAAPPGSIVRRTSPRSLVPRTFPPFVAQRPHRAPRGTGEPRRLPVHCPPMEDRITPGLYLEMTDRDVDQYVEARLPEVLDRDGVTRATWWRNVFRDRPDLPRRLPEFDHL